MADAVTVVQARTGSTRLPGKVLLPIGDKPMVLHVLERAARIGPRTILATSDDPSDDQLAALVADAGYEVRRGSTNDVLDRFVRAMPDDARYLVRVTADCPFFDPSVGRAVLAAITSGDADYASNTLPPTFPDGLDCWAVTADALRRTWREATVPSDREHVFPYIWRQPERFRVRNVSLVPALADERWTVDDERDLAFARAVHARLEPRGSTPSTSLYAVLEVLREHPELRGLNAGSVRDAGYASSVAAEARAPR